MKPIAGKCKVEFSSFAKVYQRSVIVCFALLVKLKWFNKMFSNFQTRQLIKDGFLVELSENSRKLRHLFLFTDLLLCAKLKKTTVG